MLDLGWSTYRPMSSKMPISTRIIAMLVAAWIPFCCCTLKVAAAMAQDELAGSLVQSCCCSQSTAPCDGEDRDPGEGPGGTCTGCCIKVMPDPPAEWTPEIVPAELTPLLLAPALEAGPGIEARGPQWLRPPDPWRPDTLFERRCLLLV